MPAIGESRRSVWLTRVAEIALALLALLLCWANVRWALRPGLFPILDELSNPTLFLKGSYSQIVHFFPNAFFADRPIGWAFVRFLYDAFGFNYTRYVECLLVIHFANCGMAFLLFRRLGVSVPISLAGLGFLGSLWTTAQTATYPGEAPDVLCLFFLLASVLALLWERRGTSLLSAILFLAALRSKEFAIVAPIAFTVLMALRLPRMPMPLRHTLRSILGRLWLHYAVLLVLGLIYLHLYQRDKVTAIAGNPYRPELHAAAIVNSLSYYTNLIFAADFASWQLPPVALILILAAVFCWAVFRRRAGIAFGVSAYVLTLLPVCVIANRAAFYVYAPQVFLILTLCLLVDEMLVRIEKRGRLRWFIGICIALVCFAWCVEFRRSNYFRDRINWTFGVRGASWRAAHDVDKQLPPMGAGTHVYVNHNPAVVPWLFLAPCPYLQLVNKQRGITCVIDQPTAQLNASYTADPGPKFLLDYHDNGSFTVAASKR
jgi:hypothetical protein